MTFYFIVQFIFFYLFLVQSFHLGIIPDSLPSFYSYIIYIGIPLSWDPITWAWFSHDINISTRLEDCFPCDSFVCEAILVMLMPMSLA